MFLNNKKKNNLIYKYTMETYKCRICKNKYHEHTSDIGSIHIKSYAKHLGFCGEDCFNELNEKGKNFYLLYRKLFTDDHKRNEIDVPNRFLKRADNKGN